MRVRVISMSEKLTKSEIDKRLNTFYKKKIVPDSVFEELKSELKKIDLLPNKI